jgi:hypothetical protein
MGGNDENRPKWRVRRHLGPRCVFFLNINVFYFMYIPFITMKCRPVPTPTPLACKHEPGVALLTTTTTPPSWLANVSRRWGFHPNHPPPSLANTSRGWLYSPPRPPRQAALATPETGVKFIRMFFLFLFHPRNACMSHHMRVFFFLFYCWRHVYEQLYACFLNFILFSIL